MSSDQANGEVDARYGPYRVVRELVRAPGAWLVEAREDNSERCIVQLARCKPATDPEAKRDRQDSVRVIEAATRHLASDPDIELLSHGATDETDGSLMLYWAMPWVDGADELGRARVDSPDQLITVAAGLLGRMELRHERGRLTPTLTEQVLVLKPDQSPTQVGLPLHLPPGWLTSDVPSLRLAPEERDRAEPRLIGDIWRVGRTLRALGAHLTDWPPDLTRIVDRLDAENLSERFPDARSALVQVEAMHSTIATSRAALEAAEGPPPLPAHQDRADTMLNMRGRSGLDRASESLGPGAPNPNSRRLREAPQAGKEAATIRVELSESERRRLFGPGDDAETALPMSRKEPYPETVIDQPVPKDLRRDRDDTIHDATLASVRQEAEMDQAGAARKKDAPTRRTVWDKADAAVPPPTKPTGPKGTVVGVRLINEPTGLRPTNDPNIPEILPPPEIMTPGAEGSSDPRGTPPQGHAARPMPGAHQGPGPMLPGPALVHNPMNHPMGGVPAMGMGAPGMHPGHHGGHPGYGPPVPPVAPGPVVSPEGGMLPGVSPIGPSGVATPPPAGPTDSAYPKPNLGGSASADIGESSKGQSRTGLNIMIAIAAFVAGIAAAVAIQSYMLAQAPELDAKGKQAPRAQTIHPAGEILLQASPAEAIVISESDGQILGKTPMRFLVPQGRDYAVLIAAPGHEPTRLLLPQRGRLRTDLVPLDERPPCRVKLRTPTEETLEGVSADVKFDDLYTISSAAVLRSPSGAGAWLVRCPVLGGQPVTTLPPRPAPVTHRLSVLSPSGATISIDGEARGKVPFREDVKARFVRVKAETLRSGAAERWVPVFAPTRMKMPTPRSAQAEPK